MMFLMKTIKEKNKYHILTHMYEIQKNGTDEPICRAADMENGLVDRVREREGGMN